MTDNREAWLALDKDGEEIERRRARDSLAIYSGLHIPAEIERDDLPGMEKLPIAARYIPAQHHQLLIEKLEALERGYVVEGGKQIPFKRLAVFMPPGSAKSMYGSVFFPSWSLGRHPTQCLIQGSYNDTLASKFGRRARNTFGSQIHRDVFGVGLAKDSRAAGEWETERGGEYFSFGMNTGVTGRRADGVILDDIVKGRKEADSKVVRDSTWETYVADVRTRMKPGAWMLYIACMTGDTPVLMADGSERPLREIRPGDRIATYDRGRVAVSTVLNWVNHGPDEVSEIRMKSGVVVKANARHPFLVEENGVAVWRRTATLKKGSVILKVTGANTGASNALRKSAKPRRNPRVCAWSTTPRPDGRPAFGHHLTTLSTIVSVLCATVTGLIFKSTAGFWPSSKVCAPSVSSYRKSAVQKNGCASIIVTTARRFAGFCATSATSLLGMARLRKPLPPPLSTCEVTRDTVLEIVEGGTEDVFDIEVERTENFIAGGLVSHNTRWHEDDPAGRILPAESIGKSGWVTAKDGERWYVLSLAAVIETQEEEDNDPLGRKIGDILWPEWFTPAMLEQERKTQGRQNWSALYQQKPRPAEGAILKRSEWRKWPKEKPPKCEYVVSVYDTAFEEGEENDYTARTTWGVFWHEEERPAEIQALQKQLGKPPISGRYCCILLERFKDKVEFPELRTLAVKHYKEWKPDRLLVEKKASGHSLLQELRRAKVPVAAIKADRSKLARAHAASAVLEQGCVFYMDRRWSEEVMDECEAFPAGEHDDIVDTCVHAWNWLRRTFHLQLRDEDDEDDVPNPVPRRLYS